ncbi:MAG: hypothetical protein EA366_11990 [Spirulina sp. DLM2.Bin59]|nr:MAG: hypothetical protein EA366_11990 [Spirulina sp. DLM2.Bin59]
MRSPQTPFLDHFILGFLTFGVGLGLGLLLHRQITPAVVTGVITVPVGYGTALVTELRHRQRDRHQRNSLRHQIHGLQAQRQTLHQAVNAALQTQGEVEHNLQSLELERDRLLDRIAELHQYRNELIHELQQIQPPTYSQSLNAPPPPDPLAQQQQEQYLQRLNQAIEVAQTDILDQQEALDALQGEQVELQQIKATLQQETAQLRHSLSRLKNQRDDLDGVVTDLKAAAAQLEPELATLQHTEAELQERLTSLQQEQDALIPALTVLHNQQQELLAQIKHQETILKARQEAYGDLEAKYTQLQGALRQEQDHLIATQTQVTTLEQELAALQQPELPDRLYALASEWHEFLHTLTRSDRAAIRAILAQDETEVKTISTAAGLTVADLIESLNEKAVMTLGDLLLDFDDKTGLLTMNEDYAVILSGSVAILFTELLALGDEP